MKNYKAPWGTSLIVISSLATILCVGISLGMVWKPGGLSPLLAVLPLAIIFGAALFTIRGYTITSDAILVHRLFWMTRLPMAGLQSAQFEPSAMRNSLRTFGNGGLFSFTGFFRNKGLGAYQAFVTDPNRTVVLRFSNRTVVMSPAAPEEFVHDIMGNNEEQPDTQIPDDWWRYLDASRILTEWFKRHLLGMFISVRMGEEIRHAVYAGFLLQYDQKLLWITVGHVIEELEDILLNHSDDILQLRWMDNCTIPGAETFLVHNRKMETFRSDEIDFGFVHIAGLDEANIRNGDQVKILSEQGWRNIHHARPEGFYIIGYPKEWIEIHESGTKDQPKGSAIIKLSCLPIQRVAFRESEGDFWTDPEGFYGKIVPFQDHEGGQPASPKGMSGAPLISLERGFDENGELRIRYYLFGVQRSWNKSGTIRAEPIEKVARIMEQHFKTLE